MEEKNNNNHNYDYDIDQKCNYLELLLFDSKCDADNFYEIKLKKSIFDNLFMKFKLLSTQIYRKNKQNHNSYNSKNKQVSNEELFDNIKMFKKTYRKYVQNNKEYTSHSDDKINVCEKDIIHVIDKIEPINHLIINYNKRDTPINMFDWSTDIHNVVDIDRTSFMFDNRYYLNFEETTTVSSRLNSTPYYTIYFNCNIKNNNEINLQKIKDLTSYILQMISTTSM
jgi:hypothetical protein